MLHEFVLSSNVLELCEADLGNDGTKFTAGSRNSVGSGSVSCREDFSGYHECSCVGSEVLEEVGEAIQDDEAFRSRGGSCELVVAES